MLLYPQALRTHILRLLAPKTLRGLGFRVEGLLHKAFGLI